MLDWCVRYMRQNLEILTIFKAFSSPDRPLHGYKLSPVIGLSRYKRYHTVCPYLDSIDVQTGIGNDVGDGRADGDLFRNSIVQSVGGRRRRHGGDRQQQTGHQRWRSLFYPHHQCQRRCVSISFAARNLRRRRFPVTSNVDPTNHSLQTPQPRYTSALAFYCFAPAMASKAGVFVASGWLPCTHTKTDKLLTGYWCHLV